MVSPIKQTCDEYQRVEDQEGGAEQRKAYKVDSIFFVCQPFVKNDPCSKHKAVHEGNDDSNP